MGEDFTQASKVVQTSESWKRNLHRYELYKSLMQGGDAVLYPCHTVLNHLTGQNYNDISYLRRLPGESINSEADAEGYTDFFERRRDQAAHHPISQRIIWTYVDTVFRQDVDRSSPSTVLGSNIMADVDLKGTPASLWLSTAYAEGLSQGWVAGLVDAPSSVEQLPSRAHERAQGIRPYLSLYEPKRVWKLELDQYDVVEYALLRESEHRWKEWMPDGWRLLNENDEVIDSGFHDFGRVPIEIFKANLPDISDPNHAPGMSAMRATALIDLQMLRAMSLQDDIIGKTGFPFYHLNVQPNDERLLKNLMLGAGFIFAFDADGEWKAPPRDSVEAVMDYVDRLESVALKIGGVHRISMESVEAHSGLALDWENAPIYATVHRWARQLHRWELQLWRLMAQALGKPTGDMEVIYPDDFSTRPVEQDLSYAKSLSDIYGSRDNAPHFVQVTQDALVRRAAKRLVGHEKDVAKAMPTNLNQEKEEAERLAAKENIEGEAINANAGAVDPTTALNGAQVQGLLSIISQVAMRQLPRESAIQIISQSFPVDAASAAAMLGEVGRSFFVDSEPMTAPPPNVQTGLDNSAGDDAVMDPDGDGVDDV